MDASLRKGLRGLGFGIIVGAVASSFAFAGSKESKVLKTAEEVLNRSAVEGVQKLNSKTLEAPCATCAANAATQPEVVGDTGVYECSEEAFASPEPSTTPSASATPAPSGKPLETTPMKPEEAKSLFSSLPGSSFARLATTNDNNPFRIKPKNSQDFAFDKGNTMLVTATYGRTLGEGSKLGKKGDRVWMEGGVQYFSEKVEGSSKTYDTLVAAQMSSNQTGIPVTMNDENGAPHQVFINSVKKTKLPRTQQGLGLNYITAGKEWDKKSFTIIGAVTLQQRDIDGHTIGDQLQTAGHSAGLAHYNDANVTANGVPGQVSMTTTNSVGGIDYVNLTVSPDVDPNEAIRQYGSYAASVTGGVNKKVTFFQYRCELKGTVKGTVGFQGGGGQGLKIDRNSKIESSLDLKTSLAKTKDGKSSALTLNTGAAVVYYPQAVTSTKTGYTTNVGVDTNFGKGKRGNMLIMGIGFAIPVGAAEDFSAINAKTDGGKTKFDNDAQMQIGFTYVFSGNKKPVKKPAGN